MFELPVDGEVKFKVLTKWIIALRRDEEGQTMAEYGVVLGVITAALVAVFIALAGDIEGAINAVRAVLP